MIANFALTADGKVSTRNHTPTGFTQPADKRRLQEIRALGDALLVGAATVSADTMSMRLSPRDLRAERTARGLPAEPLRVIVSNGGNLSLSSGVFKKGGAPRVVFSTQRMPQKTRTLLVPLADLWLFDAGKVDLAASLRILRSEYGIRTLICEGGPTLFRSLLDIGAMDELRLTWASVIFGGSGAPTLTTLPGPFLGKTIHAQLVKMEPGGRECYLTYRIRKASRLREPA